MQENRRYLFLEISLLGLILFSVVFFGAVHPWASMSLYAALFFLVICYPRVWQEAGRLSHPLPILFAAVFLYILFQIFV